MGVLLDSLVAMLFYFKVAASAIATQGATTNHLKPTPTLSASSLAKGTVSLPIFLESIQSKISPTKVIGPSTCGSQLSAPMKTVPTSFTTNFNFPPSKSAGSSVPKSPDFGVRLNAHNYFPNQNVTENIKYTINVRNSDVQSILKPDKDDLPIGYTKAHHYDDTNIIPQQSLSNSMNLRNNIDRFNYYFNSVSKPKKPVTKDAKAINQATYCNNTTRNISIYNDANGPKPKLRKLQGKDFLSIPFQKQAKSTTYQLIPDAKEIYVAEMPKKNCLVGSKIRNEIDNNLLTTKTNNNYMDEKYPKNLKNLNNYETEPPVMPETNAPHNSFQQNLGEIRNNLSNNIYEQFRHTQTPSINKLPQMVSLSNHPAPMSSIQSQLPEITENINIKEHKFLPHNVILPFSDIKISVNNNVLGTVDTSNSKAQSFQLLSHKLNDMNTVTLNNGMSSKAILGCSNIATKNSTVGLLDNVDENKSKITYQHQQISYPKAPLVTPNHIKKLNTLSEKRAHDNSVKRFSIVPVVENKLPPNANTVLTSCTPNMGPTLDLPNRSADPNLVATLNKKWNDHKTKFYANKCLENNKIVDIEQHSNAKHFNVQDIIDANMKNQFLKPNFQSAFYPKKLNQQVSIATIKLNGQNTNPQNTVMNTHLQSVQCKTSSLSNNSSAQNLFHNHIGNSNVHHKESNLVDNNLAIPYNYNTEQAQCYENIVKNLLYPLSQKTYQILTNNDVNSCNYNDVHKVEPQNLENKGNAQNNNPSQGCFGSVRRQDENFVSNIYKGKQSNPSNNVMTVLPPKVAIVPETTVSTKISAESIVYHSRLVQNTPTIRNEMVSSLPKPEDIIAKSFDQVSINYLTSAITQNLLTCLISKFISKNLPKKIFKVPSSLPSVNPISSSSVPTYINISPSYSGSIKVPSVLPNPVVPNCYILSDYYKPSVSSYVSSPNLYTSGLSSGNVKPISAVPILSLPEPSPISAPGTVQSSLIHSKDVKKLAISKNKRKQAKDVQNLLNKLIVAKLGSQYDFDWKKLITILESM